MTKTLSNAAEVAENTKDAYSFEAFGMDEWTKSAQMLLDLNYSLAEVEMILRSKYTRWARDHADDGEDTAENLRAFVMDLRNYIKPGQVRKELRF